jgi:hypothetical protein
MIGGHNVMRCKDVRLVVSFTMKYIAGMKYIRNSNFCQREYGNVDLQHKHFPLYIGTNSTHRMKDAENIYLAPH